MKNTIMADIKNATEKAIAEMAPFKTQAEEKYNYLVGMLNEVITEAMNKIDAMDNIQLEAMGISDAKDYISYFARSQEASRFGAPGKQIMALVAKQF